MKRRKFLNEIGKLSAAPILLDNIAIRSLATPAMLPLISCQEINERVLVIVFLKGGNDGLNTVIPIAGYDQYANLRPDIKIANTGVNSFINLDTTLSNEAQVGIHPVGTSFKDLYDSGFANIIQGVGYPLFNLSHFKSMDLWLSGGDGKPENFNIPSGWMGRYFDAAFPNISRTSTALFPDPLGIQMGDKKPSLALHNHYSEYIGSNLTGQDPASLFGLLNGIGTSPHTQSLNSDYGAELEYIMAVENSTNSFGSRITSVYNAGTNSAVDYPDTSLANQLKTVARFISGGSSTKIYMVHIDGFDTHSNQVRAGAPHVGRHAALLKDVFDSIKSFQDDLINLNLGHKVLTATFSEFGRRITQNGSKGTDHGTLSNMFLFGQGVAPGITGTNLDLINLTESGNLLESSMQYDYRSVFKSLIQDWLGADDAISEQAIGAYNKIPNLIKPAFHVDPSCYLPPVCNPCECSESMLVLSDIPIADNTIIRSADWVETNGTILRSTNVILQAKDFILLSPGFIAQDGSVVSISIEDCETTNTFSDSTTDKLVSRSTDLLVASLLEEEESELIIYPNPAKIAVNIFYRIQQEQYVSIYLHNLEGALVGVLLDNAKKESGMWSLVLDRGQLTAGSYIISMRTEKELLSKQLLFLQ